MPSKAQIARGVVQAWGRILTGRRPNLSIEITRECPLRCPGCYAFGDNHLGGSVTLRGLADYKGDELVRRFMRPGPPGEVLCDPAIGLVLVEPAIACGLPARTQILCDLVHEVVGRWVEKAGERRRRFYRITPSGRRLLKEQRRSWRAFFETLTRVARIHEA